MSRFAIKTPYLIVVVCLIVALVGGVSILRMPVDMFPAMNIPVVVVATFYSGMPPEQIEGNITFHLERMFTLASGIEHIESRSLPGCQRNSRLLQSRQQCGFRRVHHRQSRYGGYARLATRYPAAYCFEI